MDIYYTFSGSRGAFHLWQPPTYTTYTTHTIHCLLFTLSPTFALAPRSPRFSFPLPTLPLTFALCLLFSPARMRSGIREHT